MQHLKIILKGLILFLFVSSAAFGQTLDSTSFVPDRPGFATPPDIIPLNVFEFEDGIQYENSIDGIIRNQNFLFSSVLLRYGLLKNAEIRIQTDFADHITNGPDHSVIYGFDPVTVGTKIKLLEQKSIVPNVSLLFNLTLPFIGKNDFRPDNAAPSLYLLMSNDLSEIINLCYNYGISWDGNSPVPTHFYAVCLSVNLNEKLSSFIESYGYFNRTVNPNFYLDAGFAYLITNHFQTDITVAGYLNSFKNYYLFNMGFAWEINN
jgi:hypothetical protein